MAERSFSALKLFARRGIEVYIDPGRSYLPDAVPRGWEDTEVKRTTVFRVIQ